MRSPRYDPEGHVCYGGCLVPRKKKNTNPNLITCGDPAKKMAKPPVSNDDSNKPSFLKALEAVVAAGRLGLLGPAARAAMEAMPDLDAECRDGKVGQETPSSIPLLGEEEEAKEGEKEEEKEAKKGNEEEKKTPSSISLLGEEEEGEKEEEKEAKKGNEEEKARKEERKNKGKIANKEGNTDVAVTPLVKGWCRARKDIWICGDRVISLSTMRSQFSRHGLHWGYGRLCLYSSEQF
ncbi:UNVERIFIED_CONTAM: hypothetical protein K2H54_063066 [Gekko kuhli]